MALDATLSVENVDGKLTVLLGSRGGARGTSTARNVDYNEAVELVLFRLCALGAAIEAAIVDSAETRALPESSRHLVLRGASFPVSIDANVRDLRLKLGAAQAAVGRKRGAKGSGNRTRALRLFLSFVGNAPSAFELEKRLAGAVV